MLRNPSCGTRRKTSLGRRFSVDRCAVIALLYLPQAALADNARHSPSASGSFFAYKKTASAAKAVLAVLAGAEGIEPSALGFGDRCSTS